MNNIEAICMCQYEKTICFLRDPSFMICLTVWHLYCIEPETAAITLILHNVPKTAEQKISKGRPVNLVNKRNSNNLKETGASKLWTNPTKWYTGCQLYTIQTINSKGNHVLKKQFLCPENKQQTVNLVPAFILCIKNCSRAECRSSKLIIWWWAILQHSEMTISLTDHCEQQSSLVWWIT